MDRVKLILLCGIPGSGKTSYAKQYIKEHPYALHLSSDLIRKELWGDEATQGDNNEVFSLMQTRAIEALNDGQSVVYDATNITRKDRAHIIALCPKFVKIECHVIWAPIETCIERDDTRERTVGKEVIERMLKRFQPPFYDEGIDEIKVVMPDRWDQLTYYTNCLTQMAIPHDNPHHTLDIYTHCVTAAGYLLVQGVPPYMYHAALFHDVGKPYVKAFVDSKGNPCEQAHYYQHQCVGSWMAYGVGYDHIVEIAWLIGVHMDPFLNTKYYNKLPAYLKDAVDLLHEADLAGH